MGWISSRRRKASALLKPLSAHTKKALSQAVSTFVQALPGSPGEAYLRERQIGTRTAERLMLGYVDPDNPPEGWQRYAGRIAIPYLNIKGDPMWIKFRATPGITPEGADKYSQEPGGGTPLYNTLALSAPGDTLVIVEGEFDTITMTALGIPAVGIPGANNWKSHFPRCLQGWSRTVMFYDDDKPGRDLVKLVKKQMPDIIPLAPPGGHHDVGEAYEAGLGKAIVRAARGIESEQDDGYQEPDRGIPATEAGPSGFNGLLHPDAAPPF
jgi:DNA primase